MPLAAHEAMSVAREEEMCPVVHSSSIHDDQRLRARRGREAADTQDDPLPPVPFSP